MLKHSFAVNDRTLVQIVDTALADAARRSGHWLVCRPGGTQWCVGGFPINPLDASRLKRGMAKLEASDPRKAAHVRSRASDSMTRLSANFPGDAMTGILHEEETDGRFSDFANDEVCPALDPETGTCDLYESRPMTCRVFGPPDRSEGGLGVCELCFQGATDEQIASCEMVVDPDNLEAKLLKELEKTRGRRGLTIVSYCVK